MKSHSHSNTWETYSKAWSAANTAERLQLFEQSLNQDCVYTDPITQATGYGELSEYILELHKNVSGVAFVNTDFKDHHDRSLAHWNMVNGNGNILSQGASYGLYGADGRLMQMTGSLNRRMQLELNV